MHFNRAINIRYSERGFIYVGIFEQISGYYAAFNLSIYLDVLAI